jgi:hypothetical protein
MLPKVTLLMLGGSRNRSKRVFGNVNEKMKKRFKLSRILVSKKSKRLPPNEKKEVMLKRAKQELKDMLDSDGLGGDDIPGLSDEEVDNSNPDFDDKKMY